MTTYLLSVYQPDGEPPPPEFLAQVTADLTALNSELRAPAPGFSPADCMRRAPRPWCVRRRGTCCSPTALSSKARSISGFTIISAPDLDAAPAWGRRMAAATTLPVEVRPFQSDAGD